MNSQLIYMVFNMILNIDTIHSLKLVQIVQRHGDRAPTNFYRNDIYSNESYWPDGIGELTRKGKTRMFEFGLTVRNKYRDYLGESPREVSVRSSALTRTLESAECFVAALYRPNGFWIWNNDSDMKSSEMAQHWQPIAVNTVLATDDGMLRTSAVCPKADQLWQQFMQSIEVRDYLNKNKDFIEYLSTKTGDEYWSQYPSPLRPLEFLSTTLRVEREHNLEMPEWADKKTLDRLRDLEIHAFYFDWNDPQIQRLRAGLILKELAQNMLIRADEIFNKSKTNGKKLYIYETHDVNQVVLMQALNVYKSEHVNRTPPTYTASLVFELHQMDDNFIVKLLYFNDVRLTNTSVDAFVELKLVDCDPNSVCTLEKFIKSIDKFIPSDWELECERISTSIPYTYFNSFSLVYLLVGILFLIPCLALMAYICRKQKLNSNKEEEEHSLDISHNKTYNK